jgi:tetratricopeptide (TPR) repeat protein
MYTVLQVVSMGGRKLVESDHLRRDIKAEAEAMLGDLLKCSQQLHPGYVCEKKLRKSKLKSDLVDSPSNNNDGADEGVGSPIRSSGTLTVSNEGNAKNRRQKCHLGLRENLDNAPQSKTLPPKATIKLNHAAVLLEARTDTRDFAPVEKALVILQGIIDNNPVLVLPEYIEMRGLLHYKLASCLEMLENFDQALVHFAIAVGLFQRIEVRVRDKLTEAKAIFGVGRAKLALSKFEDAVNSFEEALGVAIDLQARTMEVDIRYKLATSYERLGNDGEQNYHETLGKALEHKLKFRVKVCYFEALISDEFCGTTTSIY